MDFATLHKQRLYIMIASLIGVIGMFLKWVNYKIPKELADMGGLFKGMMDKVPSVNGWDMDGGFVFFIAILGAGVLAFLGDQKTNLAKNAWLGVMGCGALALLFTIFKLFKLLGKDGYGPGLGLWLCVASAIAVAVIAYLFRAPNQDLKQSLTDMKKTVENKLDNDPNT